MSDKLSDNVNAAASRALESGIRDQLRSAGIELDGTPDCSTDGTLSGSGCTGTITVVVDGRTVVESEEIPSCSVSF